MCGIAGSINLEEAHKLYLENLDRGGFGSGFLATYQGSPLVLKQKEIFDLEYLKEQCGGKNYWYFLFHSRAPTNKDSVWTVDTTHPFVYDGWHVAQNGIISNAEEFRSEYDFIVDTQIIPYHVFQNYGNIPEVYSRYTGLLTSWLYNSTSDFLYLAKAGSSLYINPNNKSFSSKPFNGANVVEDGTLWSYLDNRWINTKQFTYNNPYFI